MDKIWEAVGTILGSFVLFLIGQKPISKWVNKIKIKNFRTGIDQQEKINQILAEIRATYGFNRVSIIDYHNGTRSFGGFSLKYGSMTFESTDESTKNIINEFQNIPCAMISDMLNDLEHNSEGYIDYTTGDGKYKQSTEVTHTMYGVDRVFNFKIGDSLIEGCLSCVWINSNHIKQFDKEDIIWIKAQAQKIRLIRQSKKI